MKKKILITILSLFYLLNCSKSDDDNQTTANNLIGIWDVTNINISHPQLGQALGTNIQGTIEFRENGSGKEDYSFDALGMNFLETESFNWISNETNIITDPNTNAELVWNRLENIASLQRASYTDQDGITYTLTLVK